MQRIRDKVVIITGASSGIGFAAAEKLAQHGAKLMLAARREDRLAELAQRLDAAGHACAVQKTDVSDAQQLNALVASTIETYGHVDVIVNNAGLMPLSFLSNTKVDEWDRMVDVNIKGVLYGIAAVIGHMKARQSGHIINVASIAGHKIFATGAVYCATKHAVRVLTEGLRMEEPDIRTTIISPGAVATELIDTISSDSLRTRLRETYTEALESEDIAEAIAWAIAQPDHVDVNEILIRPLKQQG